MLHSEETMISQEKLMKSIIPNKSPLENLGIGMVSQLVLDLLHLLYLGVVQHLLLAWIRGSYSVRL